MKELKDPISETTNKAVAAATTLLVGIYVFAKIVGAMPIPEQEGLANATNTTIATTAQAFGLGAVAIIVMFAVLILGIITSGFSGSGRQPPRGGNGGNDGPPPMH